MDLVRLEFKAMSLAGICSTIEIPVHIRRVSSWSRPNHYTAKYELSNSNNVANFLSEYARKDLETNIAVY